ncbi:MAG TPA: 3-hydroxybutyryl-CoA dehydrogenase [Gemmatimonadetes bacterium]|jgi:3-hydroxybutyryl-CoA dehydrogenase|nr:3-hydroxybutyryl-CoA dehydrogenase [Gemmatimonadota bacterium]|tara:strand:- start:2569 stop:3423 length:855 start_codon:yes stop_codon:yes gene_type:complete
MSIERIAVVGGGTMGNGIAHVAAQAGKEVRLIDLSGEVLERAVETINRNLDRQLEKQLIDEMQRDSTLARIQTYESLEAGVEDVELVVEAVPEVTTLKYSIFEELDRVTGSRTILASNTSSISITEIAARTQRPEQVIGMHFMNPVPVMTLVEVIRGLATSDETIKVTLGLTQELGKTPVEVSDFPGFVSNRVLMPMINEAIFALMEGVATPEAIDAVMKLGMNHPMGPLELADLIGLDTCLNILEVLNSGLGSDRYRPCPLLRKYVAAGWLGRKTSRGFYEYP